ncbi:MAG: sulfatase family protein [Saccharofermentanales bacterium]
MKQKNVLYIMCDQLRFDTIAALGNQYIKTPNLDRLVKRGLSFTNAYSSCPVCVPARYTIRTGCEPYNTGYFSNADWNKGINARENCGEYLAEYMRSLGYYTFGIGKFHTVPYNEDLGYDFKAGTEELWSDDTERDYDAYLSYIKKNFKDYAHIEQPHGERTEMYYMPQSSPFPKEQTVEAFVSREAIKQIEKCKEKPYFGFISFIGPHPPCAPPIPYNRMYNPDNMPDPIESDINIDHMDSFIPFMNHAVWAEDINKPWAHIIKARYYGEISYIDDCIGKILDAVEQREDADDTLICFFADHGDHLGDHHGWQKESFFDVSCKVPFLISLPGVIPENKITDDFVCLADFFGIASYTAGKTELRDGHAIMESIINNGEKRKTVFGFYETPGDRQFKIMVREGDYKYIYITNGGREQLFNLKDDKNETIELSKNDPDLTKYYRNKAVEEIKKHERLLPSLDGDDLKSYEFYMPGNVRMKQFDISKGVYDFTCS